MSRPKQGTLTDASFCTFPSFYSCIKKDLCEYYLSIAMLFVFNCKNSSSRKRYRTLCSEYKENVPDKTALNCCNYFLSNYKFPNETFLFSKNTFFPSLKLSLKIGQSLPHLRRRETGSIEVSAYVNGTNIFKMPVCP